MDNIPWLEFTFLIDRMHFCFERKAAREDRNA